MFWRREPFCEPLTAQARFVVRLSETAANYFQSPSDAGAFAAAQAAHAERDNHRAASSVLKALVHPLRQESLRLSRLLHEGAVEIAWAVEEGARFEVQPDAARPLMAQSLKDALIALEAALSSRNDRPFCEARLIEAKRWAGEAERLHRLGRDAALNDANVVSGLKSAAVARRLSQAAGAVSEAAERVAELLVAEVS